MYMPHDLQCIYILTSMHMLHDFLLGLKSWPFPIGLSACMLSMQGYVFQRAPLLPLDNHCAVLFVDVIGQNDICITIQIYIYIYISGYAKDVYIRVYNIRAVSPSTVWSVGEFIRYI